MEYKDKYSQEEVQELINWFKNYDLPQSLQINKATYCLDLKTTINAICSQATKHHENSIFNYAVRLLNEIKATLENK